MRRCPAWQKWKGDACCTAPHRLSDCQTSGTDKSLSCNPYLQKLDFVENATAPRRQDVEGEILHKSAAAPDGKRPNRGRSPSDQHRPGLDRRAEGISTGAGRQEGTRSYYVLMGLGSCPSGFARAPSLVLTYTSILAIIVHGAKNGNQRCIDCSRVSTAFAFSHCCALHWVWEVIHVILVNCT